MAWLAWPVPTALVYCLPIAENSWENFRGTLKNRENHETLAQQIFPRLRYIFIFYYLTEIKS